MNTPLVPPYGRIVYDYTNPMWIPSAIKNAQSNCMKEPRKQNRKRGMPPDTINKSSNSMGTTNPLSTI